MSAATAPVITGRRRAHLHRPWSTLAHPATASSVEGVDVPVFLICGADPAGGGVEGPELLESLLFGRQGGLEGVGKLGVVHGHDPEASFQLDDLHFGPRELEIDCFSHSLPSYVRL